MIDTEFYHSLNDIERRVLDQYKSNEHFEGFPFASYLNETLMSRQTLSHQYDDLMGKYYGNDFNKVLRYTLEI